MMHRPSRWSCGSSRSESTFDCVASTQTYLARHGKPVAFHSDRGSIFRVTGAAPGGPTQFSLALADLNIDIVCAN